MTEERKQKEMNKALFTNLVVMLSSSVIQQLGKLVNPLTNKTEVNLQAAQVTIDMLVMLQEKTKGNLDKDEEKMLNDILASLQMNYVETSKAAPAQEKEESEEKSEAGSAKAEDQPARDDSRQPEKPEEKKEAGGQKADAKYHKSYGE